VIAFLFRLLQKSILFSDIGTDALEYVGMASLIIPAVGNAALVVNSKVESSASRVLLR
jgi:hypothetical protein